MHRILFMDILQSNKKSAVNLYIHVIVYIFTREDAWLLVFRYSVSYNTCSIISNITTYSIAQIFRLCDKFVTYQENVTDCLPLGKARE